MSLRLTPTLLVAALVVASPAAVSAQSEAVPTSRETAAAPPPAPPPRRALRPPGPIAPDPFSNLRDDQAPATQAWISGHDASTRAKLTGDPRYAEALAAVDASLQRQSPPQFIGADIYSLLQSAARPRGLWRRTRLEAFVRGRPQWEGVLDLDALAKADGREWVWGGAVCEGARAQRCLVRLTDPQGASVREFDVAARAFTPGGFRLGAEAGDFAWLDRDTLLVSVGAGAGKPSRIVRLRRGEAFATAPEIFRTDARLPEARSSEDLLVPLALADGDAPRLQAVIVERSGRATEFYVLVDGAFRRFPLAEDFGVVGIVGGRLVFQLNQGWVDPALGVRLTPGQLLAFNLGQIVKRSKELTPEPVLNLSGRPYVLQASATRSAVLLKVRENDGVHLYACTPGRLGWSVRRVAVPDDGVIAQVSAAAEGDDVLVDLERFPRPFAYAIANGVTPSVSLVPPEPTAARSPPVVEPARTTARDGAPLEYVTAHAAGPTPAEGRPVLALARPEIGLALDSTEVELGSAWLAAGGEVAVITRRDRATDVRNAPLRTLLAYNDLATLAQDLVKRGLAKPGRIGLLGAEDGGLTAAIASQRFRRLWSAVALVDPTLDLLRPDRLTPRGKPALDYGDPREFAIRRFWDETSPYENLKRGVAYPPTLLVEGGEGAGRTDARRFTARMEALGAPALFESFRLGGGPGWSQDGLVASVLTFLRAAS